jgi:hypothetical protein
VYIIDPLVGTEDDETVFRSHLCSIATMEKHLSKAIIDLFDGWTPKFNSCDPIVLRAPGMPCNRYVFSLLLYFFHYSY